MFVFIIFFRNVIININFLFVELYKNQYHIGYRYFDILKIYIVLVLIKSRNTRLICQGNNQTRTNHLIFDIKRRFINVTSL